MPNCKNYQLNIPRFYRWQTFDHIMFGYVQGLRKALPGMKISEAILLFLESFDIEEDNYCFDAAKQAYYRILNSIVEMNDRSKTDGDTVI
jgi:hypothetical protein